MLSGHSVQSLQDAGLIVQTQLPGSLTQTWDGGARGAFLIRLPFAFACAVYKAGNRGGPSGEDALHANKQTCRLLLNRMLSWVYLYKASGSWELFVRDHLALRFAFASVLALQQKPQQKRGLAVPLCHLLAAELPAVARSLELDPAQHVRVFHEPPRSDSLQLPAVVLEDGSETGLVVDMSKGSAVLHVAGNHAPFDVLLSARPVGRSPLLVCVEARHSASLRPRGISPKEVDAVAAKMRGDALKGFEGPKLAVIASLRPASQELRTAAL